MNISLVITVIPPSPSAYTGSFAHINTFYLYSEAIWSVILTVLLGFPQLEKAISIVIPTPPSPPLAQKDRGINIHIIPYRMSQNFF